MCGIFGSFSFDRQQVSEDIVAAMSQSVFHRGPDASGHFQDDRVVIGNTRLSIVDLSHASDQPIYSDDQQIAVVQNGEIFNYLELREELAKAGIHFRTSGDTEVILRAYEHWGPDFVKQLNGMFAIAVYDIEKQKLLLYRDRLGVKPLFIADPGNGAAIWFGSEIKTILANGINYVPDMDALAQYFALNYVPQPTTAFLGIEHLPPGHMMEVSPLTGSTISRYWDLSEVTPNPQMTPAEAKAELVRLLDDATRIRMRSDAPFGAFLSGGLDSSSVVGFMSLYQSERVRTFSIGFDDARFDETIYARQVSKRFGTIHETRTMGHNAVGLWPKMIWHCDQPHGDVSFMPTNEVSSLAVKDVKMVLTGDGGDELFAGYEKYLSVFPDGKTDGLIYGWEQSFAEKSGLLHGEEPSLLLAGSLRDAFFDRNPYRQLVNPIKQSVHQDPINRVLLAETLTLLPGNNLVKPDRMAMANSLEVRSPFLDYRMAEFAFQVPGHLKLTNGETKSIYKQAMEPLLGKDLTYRKKQMFTVPVGEWFREELAGFCREILLDGRLEERKIVCTSYISEMLQKHVEGTANYTRQLRALISLEIWFRLFVDRDPVWLEKAKKN